MQIVTLEELLKAPCGKSDCSCTEINVFVTKYLIIVYCLIRSCGVNDMYTQYVRWELEGELINVSFRVLDWRNC
jgi:hypothetical protein